MIWSAWTARPADEVSSSDSALSEVQEYWTQSGNRLRDSTKWMATVLGAALAALIGTSPLALIRGHHFGTGAIVLGAVGLLLLGVTLFLIVQVMRPQALSFTDVQSAKTWPMNTLPATRCARNSRRPRPPALPGWSNSAAPQCASPPSGEYYALRSRSTWATYGGILCGLIGTAAIIAAFAWPPA